MGRWLPTLSRVMLGLGVGLILVGIGWGLWMRFNKPPAPVITDAGAVVLAETAPVSPTTQPTATIPSSTPIPTGAPMPTATLTAPQSPTIEGPTPELLPEWTITPPPPAHTPTNLPTTDVPPTPSPTPTATPTSLPRAEEPPTRIVAPTIELDGKVEAMGWEMIDKDGTLTSEWVVPKNAAGWHMNSALPGHGENVVLSGHHNIDGKVFRYVVDLSIGDEVTLYADGNPYTYAVSEKYILKEYGMPLEVRKKNAQWIMPSGDERLTLVTCWPYEWPGYSHRVIVVAKPLDSESVQVPGIE